MEKKYNKEQILNEVIRIIKENYYAVKNIELTGETPLKGGDIIDSFGLINIVVNLETFFDIDISDRKWQKLCKIDDLVELIYSKI